MVVLCQSPTRKTDRQNYRHEVGAQPTKQEPNQTPDPQAVGDL